MANILNARWNISADDMSIPNAIEVHIYSAIGFRNLQLYVEYKWNWNEFYAGQAMKIQWGKMKFSNDCRFHYRLRLIDIQVHLFCIFWISTRISIFAIHCNGIVNGNCDRDLCLCLYYLYDEDNRPHSWFRRRMVGSFVGLFYRHLGAPFFHRSIYFLHFNVAYLFHF